MIGSIEWCLVDRASFGKILQSLKMMTDCSISGDFYQFLGFQCLYCKVFLYECMMSCHCIERLCLQSRNLISHHTHLIVSSHRLMCIPK